MALLKLPKTVFIHRMKVEKIVGAVVKPLVTHKLRVLDFNQVTTIGKNAFKGCTGITSLVAIHVKTINKEAF